MEDCSVGFEFRKGLNSSVDDQRISLVFCKASRRLVCDRSVCLDFRKACKRFVDDQRISFVFHKACTKLVEVLPVTFH